MEPYEEGAAGLERYQAIEPFGEIKIKVIIEPAGEGIITGFPVY